MPSLMTLPAPTEAPPPLPRRRRHQRRPPEPVPDWAGLPPELISCILHKLDPFQIMLGADKVCRSWRRATREEPELWRRMDRRGYQYQALQERNLADVNQNAIDAVRRSQGQCQAFGVEGTNLGDVFLHFLAERAPLLMSLVLVSCKEVSCQGFLEAIKGLPLLKELELSNCWKLQHKEVLEVVAEERPRLKCLRYRRFGPCHYARNWKDDGEAMAIAKMHELRSLHLVHNGLTNLGLEAILNKCLHLESLGIHNCLSIRMNDKMRARINTKKLLINTKKLLINY